MSESNKEKYYGKFRGTVTSIDDPQKMGRLKANVPSINGSYETGWCLPCFPYAGDDHCCQLMPHVGDVVWIEFERGDLEYPIWVGSPMCAGQDKFDGIEHMIRTPHGQIIFAADGTIILCNNRMSGLLITPEEVLICVNKGAGTLYKHTEAVTLAPNLIKSDTDGENLLYGRMVEMFGRDSAVFKDMSTSWTPGKLKSEIELAKTLP